MDNTYMSPDQFAALPPEEQVRIMKEYISSLSIEKFKILKK